ncbi:MAG TPA: hypothetical protein VHC69_06005 [Polyangiaceae bacterium]|nr:hypothetical protein [Polyangiaceae bacterium]
MSDLSAALANVQNSDFTGYGPREIPCELDETVAALVDAFVATDVVARRRIIAAGDDMLSRILLVFAERMASLSMREVSTGPLFRGLVAAIADGWVLDVRENVSALSLLHDACVRLGRNPDEEFDRVRAYASAKVAEGLTRFLARKPEDKAIKAMGYRAGADADGFRYERTW